MIYALGPKARRVYDSILSQISSGQLSRGDRLPSHIQLSEEFGVAPLTVRQVLARLEEEGIVERAQGRGTFVRSPGRSSVLIVGNDEDATSLLAMHIQPTGYIALRAASSIEALSLLKEGPEIALVFSDVSVPDKTEGLQFIRTVRRRWSKIPLVAIISKPDDLAELHGTPEYPILILTKPMWTQQIQDVLTMVLRMHPSTAAVR